MTAPEPISERHDVSRFRSGAESLDIWLQRKARLNEAKGGLRTYVVCDRGRVTFARPAKRVIFLLIKINTKRSVPGASAPTSVENLSVLDGR